MARCAVVWGSTYPIVNLNRGEGRRGGERSNILWLYFLESYSKLKTTIYISK
jgi:hypothetical protein